MDNPRTLSAAEARANFSEIVTDAGYAGRDTIIERNNRPVAVVIGYAEYQALRGLRDRALRERKALFEVIDKIHARNQDADAEEVERLVAEAVESDKRAKHPRRQRSTLPQALGLLAQPGQPAPTDADIRALLDERRMKH